jgi:hypothetical protein
MNSNEGPQYYAACCLLRRTGFAHRVGANLRSGPRLACRALGGKGKANNESQAGDIASAGSSSANYGWNRKLGNCFFAKCPGSRPY